MKYDFETVVNRSTQGSLKWKCLSKEEVEKGIVPLSVADMEFKTAPEIVEGLKEHLETNILGYTGPTDAYYNATKSFLYRHHGIQVETEECIITQGVVSALFYAVQAFTKPTDAICILTPVYYPFRMVIEANERELVQSELVYQDGAYTIDFDDLEMKLASSQVSLMIFCSPHNPIGRVWKKEEVEKVVTLCKKHNVFLISDEIHMDLIMPNHTHVSAALFMEYRDNLMLCTSCSKTFNLAGMQVSNIFVFNQEKREALRNVLGKHHAENTNNLAYKALELAYTKCDGWLEELLQVINTNRLLVKSYIEEHLPKAKVIELEGTYLQWIDLTYLNISTEELENRMKEQHLYLDEGYVFGKGGELFERITLACPTKVIEKALERLVEACK